MKTKGISQTRKGWTVSVSRDGVRRTALCKTKAAAIERQRELLAELFCAESPAHVIRTNGSLTLGQSAERSLADRWANVKSLDSVTSYLNQVLDFLGRDTPLAAIDRMDLVAMQQHYINTGNAGGTVNKKLAILRSIFTDVLDDKLIADVPKFPKKIAARALKDRVFSKQEEAAFIEYFQKAGREEGADIFCFLLDTCARWSEAEKLKIWDVDFVLKKVTFEDRKANNLGSVPLTRRALAIAKKYQHRGSGSRMFNVKYDTFKSWFNEGKRVLGITDPRLTTHCTRHTCATRLAEGNISLALIMNYGGWTSLKSVRRYLHVNVHALGACTEVLEGSM
jgi:integrase